jgi:phosphoribosyl-ATP pyrophosphohydrolase/phosphoribosyl-AMP cyclohydrolase
MNEIENLKYDARGLIPAIVQDASTQEVLMLGYMNETSLRRTIETGETWFWSRSRKELWHKGATSGNTQRVRTIRFDCDHDTLVVMVEPAGPACHTGARSCFHNDLKGAPYSKESARQAPRNLGEMLDRLYVLIETRNADRPEGSYTTYLFNQGLDKILKKIGEESAEMIIASKNEEKGALVAETCDFLYHLMVLMVERGVKLDDLRRELAHRRLK